MGLDVRLWTATDIRELILQTTEVCLQLCGFLVKRLFAHNSLNQFIQNELKMAIIGVLFR